MSVGEGKVEGEAQTIFAEAGGCEESGMLGDGFDGSNGHGE